MEISTAATSQTADGEQFFRVLGTLGVPLALKLYRMRIELPTAVPTLPCLDHEAMLHEGIAPHAAAYIQDATGNLHEIVYVPEKRRIDVETVSTVGESSAEARSRFVAALQHAFPDHRIRLVRPSWMRGDQRVANACRAQVTLRDVLMGPDLDRTKAAVDRLQTISSLMEKESRVASWGARTVMTPLLALIGFLTYMIIGSFGTEFGAWVDPIRYIIVGLVGGFFMYYGLKAVHLTEMANRVWKRSAEYGLILSERRRLKPHQFRRADYRGTILSMRPFLRRRSLSLVSTAFLVAMCPLTLIAWGVTGHRVIARAAVIALPSNVPAFVKQQIDWIGVRSITPDSYRAASEPFIKMEEDPSHEWHLEQVAFLKTIPRSRVEFVQAVYDDYKRLEPIDPKTAATRNVRTTGTLPYTTIEVYERLKVTFRTWRDQQKAKEDSRFTELDAAFYIGWLSHYVADAAQPLHSSIHHDGWIGDNPKNYTRDGALHWGFENDFVDLIGLAEGDIQNRIAPARVIADPFSAILDHLARSHTRVEQVYVLEQQHAFGDKSSTAARELVYACTSDAAAMLRDLVYTAWMTSAAPAAPRTGIVQPNDPANPRYNPSTGSAPADIPR